MTDYITANDVIIFSPHYNKPLNLELNIQSNLKKIIFSNVELNDKLLEAYDYNKYRRISSKFDQPLANSLDNCTALTHIIFGFDYDQPLANSLDNCTALTHIVFGFCYDQPLDNSLDNCIALTHIVFDFCYKQPLANSLNKCTSLTHIILGDSFNYTLGDLLDNCTSLTHIGIGYNFNQKVNLPSNIRFLSLNSNNGFYTEYLPDTVEELELGVKFNLKLDNLPSSIKKITFYKESRYDRELNCLPYGLSILQLPYVYKHKIYNIPCGLTKLICCKDYMFTNDFSDVEIEIETYW